jgi:hypothetical protein
MFGKEKREEEQERQRINQEEKDRHEKWIKEEDDYYAQKNYIIVQGRGLKSYHRDWKPSEVTGRHGNLESEVQRHIELGWRVHGSVFTTSEDVTRIGEKTQRIKSWCQPMVKD